MALTRILATAPPTNHSTLACLYFFRVCKTRADLEWGASMLRRYHWFSDHLFQEFFDEDANNFYKEKFISCIQQRDLAWGVISDRVGYERRLEVYHPNFCGRQLGFKQVIPVPFFDLVQCGTSYHLHFPLEAIFQASRHSLEVMTKIAHKHVTLHFECTTLFTTW